MSASVTWRYANASSRSASPARTTSKAAPPSWKSASPRSRGAEALTRFASLNTLSCERCGKAASSQSDAHGPGRYESRRLRAAPSGQQFLQPFGDLLRGALVGKAGGAAALRVHHIDDRAVLHRILAAGFRVLRVIHPIALSRLSDLLRGPGQGNDRSVEARDIGFERFGRVALGIDRDEHGAHRVS